MNAKGRFDQRMILPLHSLRMKKFAFKCSSKARSRFTDLFTQSLAYKRRAPPPFLNDNQVDEDDPSHSIAIEAAARTAERTALFVLDNLDDDDETIDLLQTKE